MSIEDDGNDAPEDQVQTKGFDKRPPKVDSSYIRFPLTDKYFEHKKSKASTSSHSRPSSFPGNIIITPENSSGASQVKSLVDGQEVLFTEVSKTISMSDSSLLNKSSEKGSRSTFNDKSLDIKPRLTKPEYGLNEDEGKTGNKESVSNFCFGAPDFSQSEKYTKALPGVKKQQAGLSDDNPDSLASASRPGPLNTEEGCNSSMFGRKSREGAQHDTFEPEPQLSVNVVNSCSKEKPFKVPVNSSFRAVSLASNVESAISSEESLHYRESVTKPTKVHTPSNVPAEPSDFGAFGNTMNKESAVFEALSLQANAETERLAGSHSMNSSYNLLFKSSEDRHFQQELDVSSSFASLQESSNNIKEVSLSPQTQSTTSGHSFGDSPVGYKTFENDIQEDEVTRSTPEMRSDSPSDPIVVIASGESLIPVMSTTQCDKNLCDTEKKLRDSCNTSPGFLTDKGDTSSLSRLVFVKRSRQRDILPFGFPPKMENVTNPHPTFDIHLLISLKCETK